MRICILFAISLFGLLSCEKDDEIYPHNNADTYSNQIILKDLKISGDSVKLTWTKLDTLKFTGYLIIRKDKKNVIVNPTDYNDSYVIKKIYDPNVTTYTDIDIPLTPYMEYQVIGLLSNKYTYNYIFSNSKTYERPSINIFEFDILDIMPDLSNNRLYIIEKSQGKISIFDYETKTTLKSLNSEATIGYCSIGDNGSTKELYVPRSDGWIFVYNAETLEKIDQIDITIPSSCVVNNSGKLFISTDAWTNRPLKVYDRITKTMISENGDFEDTRLRLIPNTNTEIIEVTINIGPTDLDYYSFNSNGSFIIHKNDNYHGDYPLDAAVFQFFPDGKKFITSSEGAIYDINLKYLNRIPKGNFLFSDFAFSADASLIYCACSNAKKIVSYSSSNFVKNKEYMTQGYPYKIFRKENSLICVSKTALGSDYSYGPSNYIIEKIGL